MAGPVYVKPPLAVVDEALVTVDDSVDETLVVVDELDDAVDSTAAVVVSALLPHATRVERSRTVQRTKILTPANLFIFSPRKRKPFATYDLG